MTESLRLEADPYKEKLFHVYLGEEELLIIHRSIFTKRPKLPKFTGDREAWFSEFYELEWKRARNYAFWLLSKRAIHSREMAEKLKDKLLSDGLVDKLCAYLKEEGYCQDEDWLASFIRVQTSRGFGKSIIRQKLFKKGLRADDLEGLELDEDLQREKVWALAKKKAARLNLEDPKDRQRLMAALLRKGHPSSLIQEVLGELREACD